MGIETKYHKDYKVTHIEVDTNDKFGISITDNGDVEFQLDLGEYEIFTSIAELKQIIHIWETRKDAKEA